MLNIGWPEMLVIAIVLIVVVGPKDLPKMMRAFGRTTSKIRKMSGEFRKQFDDAIKEAELDELKDLANEVRRLNPASELKKAMSQMERAAKDVKAGLDSATNPTKPDASGASASAAATPAPASNVKVARAKAASRPLPEAVGVKRAEAAAKAARPAALAKPNAAAAPSRAAVSSKVAGAPAKAPAANPRPNPQSAGAKSTKPADGASKVGKRN